MTFSGLDTHEIFKKLKAAGFSEPQAEAVSDVVQDAHNFDLSAVATKVGLADESSELAEVKVDLAAVKTDVAEVKADLALTKTELLSKIDLAILAMKADLAGRKADMLKWIMIGSVGLQTIVIIGAVIALARMTHS